jgi:hypothetical protein
MDEPETPDEPVAGPGAAANDEPDPAPADPAFERPVDKFRRTAAGTAIAAGMFGLRDALEGRPEREETVMEVPAPTSQPVGDIEVVVDLEHPENSRVVVRRPESPGDQN